MGQRGLPEGNGENGLSKMPISPWEPVYIWSMETADQNKALNALLNFLGVRLERRWGGDGVGVEWRVSPKEG